MSLIRGLIDLLFFFRTEASHPRRGSGLLVVGHWVRREVIELAAEVERRLDASDDVPLRVVVPRFVLLKPCPQMLLLQFMN